MSHSTIYIKYDRRRLVCDTESSPMAQWVRGKTKHLGGIRLNEPFVCPNLGALRQVTSFRESKVWSNKK